MSALTLTTPTIVHSLDGFVYNNSVTANNSSGNTIAISMPPNDWQQGRLVALSVDTEGSQTVHDIAPDGEACVLRILINGVSFGAPYVAKRILNWADSNSAIEGWVASFEPADLAALPPLGTNDMIHLSCPPPDDGGTPTGDYRVVWKIARLR